MKRCGQQPTAGLRSALLSKRETPDAIGRKLIHLWRGSLSLCGCIGAHSLFGYQNRGIHFAYPLRPLTLNRCLYHFLSADTKKHRNFDTMGIKVAVLLFCLKALISRDFGLLSTPVITRQSASLSPTQSAKVLGSSRLLFDLWVSFNYWAIVLFCCNRLPGWAADLQVPDGT